MKDKYMLMIAIGTVIIILALSVVFNLKPVMPCFPNGF